MGSQIALYLITDKYFTNTVASATTDKMSIYFTHLHGLSVWQKIIKVHVEQNLLNWNLSKPSNTR